MRWWRRQGHASLRVISSRGHALAKATVLMFAKLRDSLVDTAEASVVDAFALKNAKTHRLIDVFINLISGPLACFIFLYVFSGLIDVF
ncbi:hypothetical protein EZV62_018270 [Acer yangbiense]|uniref:Uncharacterized protein n=1 Tax=Acer yangbiense TaxID=1000413 RepID=A0A5C7HIX5_9ROSI|nr:hypothetical protein EZV62_018270 [Acer yangbiense]